MPAAFSSWVDSLQGIAQGRRSGSQTGRRANRKALRAVRSRISIGRIGHRPLGAADAPPRPYGRGEIVARFHVIRRQDHPPVFVLEGVHGSQKSQLLDHLIHNFKMRRSWHVREEIVAKVDCFAVDPQPAAVFASFANQLTASSSWIRRMRAPRLHRIEALLASEQRRTGAPMTQVAGGGDALVWLAKLGSRVASIVTHTPIPSPSPGSKAQSFARDVWWFVSPTRAGRWARRFSRALPDPLEAPDGPRQRMELLQAGLGDALAADLHRATRRFVLPVNEVALFIDCYHRAEQSAQPSFLVNFSERIAELGARVLIVVACRRQERWETLADGQDDCEDFEIMKVSERVEIHRLGPLNTTDCIHALREMGVPAHLTPELARRSAGMPVAVRLLGAIFGRGAGNHPSLRAMLERLPDPDQVEDDEWFAHFTSVVAEALVEGLEPALELHLRAAATLRNFDDEMLAALLGEQFSERIYKKLIESEFVGAPRPSALLGTQRSFRVRSFVREILARDESERMAVMRWHQLADEHLERLAKRASDAELAFRLEAEVLFHRLYTQGDEAQGELFQRFQDQLLSSRTDRCEALLWIALDYNRTDERWRAMVLAHAGQMYLVRDRHPLAEERLTEAKQLVSLDEADSWLAVSISLALARCYRLQERIDEARAEFALLSARKEVHPVVVFQGVWFGCLIAKASGHVAAAREAAEEAGRLLRPLLSGPDAADNAAAAESFWLTPLARKQVHLVRLEADLARCAGDYATADAKTDEALAGYREHPENGIEEHTRLIRAHLLRQEGDTESCFAIAQEAYGHFTERQPYGPRSAGHAMRAMAQARLLGAEPEQARPMLEELAEMDPSVYPAGRPFALFGIGELERLAEEHASARRHYRLSEQSTPGGAVFERCYAQLGLIELDRIERPHLVNGEIRRLRSQPGVLDHPALDFLSSLLQVRAFGREGEGVAAAERAIERFSYRSEGPGWEEEMLRTTLAAIDSGGELPTLVFNLP